MIPVFPYGCAINEHGMSCAHGLKLILIVTGVATLFSIVIGYLYIVAKLVPFEDFLSGEISLSDVIEISQYKSVCDRGAIDLWSIAHFIIPAFLVALFFYFTHNRKMSFWITMGIGVVWEIYEILSSVITYNFSCESEINMICDLITDLAGAGVMYLLLGMFDRALKMTNMTIIK